MNRSPSVIAFVCRCRKAFVPSLPSQTHRYNRCLSVPNQRRFFASSSNEHNMRDCFPKLPIEAPAMFTMDLAQRQFKQLTWAEGNRLDVENVLTTNATAEKVLMFVSECVAKNEFEVLKEKLSPEALEKARSIATSESETDNLIFKGTSKHLFFQSETRFFTPWVFTAERCDIILTYLGLLASKQRQSLWGITLVIRKSEDGDFSEDFDVTDYFFKTEVFDSNHDA
ncbi:uncharacterized protein LOC117647554 [Thrips palmi]|uniref:Uncharacterized protein LOC117647554 n=1 Tax=Thrips palmi TaxID=161013 RepID=A0A6P8Z563_THRPL|nr:uncharacterized protein LOC117647554 [Thrips palmi]